MTNPRLFSFIGGMRGPWQVIRQQTMKGDPLPTVSYIDVVSEASRVVAPSDGWILQGVTSNERYVTKEEKTALIPLQPSLGRPEATLAAMIPLSKSGNWWSLTQDERRDIFHRSSHNQVGMKALPAIARRLHHCRDLASMEPFDFVTWFEFAPEDEPVFDDLMAKLRASEEWQFVNRDCEIRMRRSASSPG